MTCYKKAHLDTVKDATATVLWRDPPVSRPEQSRWYRLVQVDLGAPGDADVGCSQVKWLRGDTAIAGRYVILDDIKVTDRSG
jgi:hypothetical protein